MLPVARPSLRDGFHGVLRALPGERCTIAPVALRISDARRLAATSPQDLTPDSGRQDHTTSPSAHIPAGSSTAGVRSPCSPCENAVGAVSYRAGRRSRFPALQPPSRAGAVAATASRPASRDDRETPLVAGGMAQSVRQNRTSVNTNILTERTRPIAGVFCPSGCTTDGRCRPVYPYSTRGRIVTMPGHSVSNSTKPTIMIR